MNDLMEWARWIAGALAAAVMTVLVPAYRSLSGKIETQGDELMKTRERVGILEARTLETLRGIDTRLDRIERKLDGVRS